MHFFRGFNHVFFILVCFFSFAVNQILSDQPREMIVEKIHENLQEVGRKVNGNEYSFEMYQIRKVI